MPHQGSLCTKAVIKEQLPERHLSAVLGIRIRIRIRTKKSRLPNTEEGSTQGTQVANQRLSFWSGVTSTYPCIFITMKNQEYSSWLMNRTFSCTACIASWSSREGLNVRWSVVGGPCGYLYIIIYTKIHIEYLSKTQDDRITYSQL